MLHVFFKMKNEKLRQIRCLKKINYSYILTRLTTINTIYDPCLQPISWYLQIQLIRNRWPPRKHLSNSIDGEPERNTNRLFWVLSHLY